MLAACHLLDGKGGDGNGDMADFAGSSSGKL